MTTPETQHIQDDGALWRFFHSMLNMDDDDLDPYQYRLLGHYRRICGAHGYCDETVAQTAKKCKIGHNKVRQIRNWLADEGYIDLERISEFEVKITLKNRLIENIQRYQGLPDQVGGSTGSGRGGSTGSGRKISNNKTSNNKKILDEASSSASTRFTKSRFYAFNPKTLRFGVKSYTAAEAKAKASELEPHGFYMIKGAELNARPDADQLIGVIATNGNTSLFSVFAKYGFGIGVGQAVSKDIGSRIGDLINQFAETLMRTRNEVEADSDLIARVNKCYEDHKRLRPTLTKPNHAASFIPWWNEWVEQHEKQPDPATTSVTSGLKFD